MNSKKTPEKQGQKIPDIEIVDLDNETSAAQDAEFDPDSAENDLAHTSDSDKPRQNPVMKFFSHVNIHIVLASISLLAIAVIVYKIVNWGEYVNLDEIFKDGAGKYDDTFDSIVRLVDQNGMPIEPGNGDDKTTIVVFGNAPFADDRNAKDSLANMIADMADATVHNCSVTGSYLASLPYEHSYAAEAPINAFNFYWLCHLAVGSLADEDYRLALETLGSAAPPEAQEVYDTIKSLDFNSVDAIAIMYDASDYLAQHPVYSNEDHEDILRFVGNLEAGVRLLQEAYPHIRIIVLSPTYAFLDEIDENTGKYIVDDVMREGYDVLSAYVILQCDSCIRLCISFVDNMNGTVTAVNAEEYLTDHLHLNTAGRRKVAERFIYALTYYDE